MKLRLRNKVRRLQRISIAEKNLEHRASRTPQQQLALLDERLGAGVGAKKERARLQQIIENKNKPKVAQAPDAPKTKKHGKTKNKKNKQREPNTEASA